MTEAELGSLIMINGCFQPKTFFCPCFLQRKVSLVVTKLKQKQTRSLSKNCDRLWSWVFKSVLACPKVHHSSDGTH
jgi:hypothetical protein